MQETDGVFQVPCKVNGIPMNFIFDTGATNVCISLTEANFLYKQGTLTNSDFQGITYLQIANGEIIPNASVVLREIEIGGLILKDVDATIILNNDAPLLLGQSAIRKLGNIDINGNKLSIYPDGNKKNAESNNMSFYDRVQEWFNDGWHYECDVYSRTNYKLKLYSKYIDGIICYHIIDPNGETYRVERNKYFGDEKDLSCKYKYTAGQYVFNLPGDNIEQEIAIIKAKKWKFIRMINLYHRIDSNWGGLDWRGEMLTFDCGNLYWREYDNVFKVVLGYKIMNEYVTEYNSEIGSTIYKENKEAREMMVHREPHDIEYQDLYEGYLILKTRHFEYRAAEYSLNF